MCPFSIAYSNIFIACVRESACARVSERLEKVRANELPGIKSINSNNELVLTSIVRAHDQQISSKSLNSLHLLLF